MKFNDMKYQRPDMDQLMAEMKNDLDALNACTSADQFMEIFRRINVRRSSLQTTVTLCQVRHSINTADSFYSAENDYWDQMLPEYQALESRFMSICLDTPCRKEIEKEIPATFFQLAQCARNSFDQKIVTLMIEENQLKTEYGRLKASAQIEFQGKTLNLAEINKYTESLDRNVRKEAYDAKMKFFSDHQEDFDRIFDRMVKARDLMAKKLGYRNYVELAYQRMNRLDYDADMVSSYRKEILAHAVPLAGKIYERQRQRLGLDQMAYYDLPISFPDGNAVPIGTADDLVNDAVRMYHEMSPETGEFIDVMVRDQLFDLLSRPGKEMGGYMTQLNDYKVPFIFSNFNGTSSDVDVLTHEAGHAFQYYLASDIEIPDVTSPTMESCEIDSMSMEFFAEPWMNLFFGEKADRYRYTHLAGTITFLPYGVLVDHFQQEVYENPEWTPAERRACWRRLEKQYQPYKNYEGCELLESGGWWYQQNHIFQSPFYYIDYTLAQVCAQEFAIRMREKDPKTWGDYLHLLKLGGTLSFTKLVKEAGLKVPFEQGTVAEVMKTLEGYLQSMDNGRI